MSVSKDKITGTWTVQCYYVDWMGRKKYKKKRGFSTKKEAQEWERNFLNHQSTNMTMTLKDFVEIYFQDKKGELKERTIRNKKYMI